MPAGLRGEVGDYRCRAALGHEALLPGAVATASRGDAMRHVVRTLGLVGAALAALSRASGAQQRPVSAQESGGRSAAPRAGAPLAAPAAPSAARPIPVVGPLPPGSPPPSLAPPPRPLPPTDMQSLAVLYSRPSPMGPPPVAVAPARAIYVVGKAPLFRQKVGPIVYADHVPPPLRTAMNGMDMFSDDNVVLPRGEVRFVAVDRTVNDSKLSRDSMALEATLVDERGDEWRIVQTRIAPVSPDPVNDPWYGGVVIDTLEHGTEGRGTPEEPKVHCVMCSWAWADVWKNGKKVASSVVLHVMLSSQTHDPANGWKYKKYDAADQPRTEVHVVIGPEANLPSADGSLHVMFEGQPEVVRGTPEQVTARAPKLQPDARTVTLNAVPTLQWSNTAIPVEVGETIRLVVNNMDPSSFHGLHIRTPDGLVMFPLPQGDQWVTTLSFDQPGEYYFYCPVSNHQNRGMYGRFVVSGGVPGGTHGPPGKGAGNGSAHAARNNHHR